MASLNSLTGSTAKASSKGTKNTFLQNMLKNLGKKNPITKVGNQPKLKLPSLPKAKLSTKGY